MLYTKELAITPLSRESVQRLAAQKEDLELAALASAAWTAYDQYQSTVQPAPRGKPAKGADPWLWFTCWQAQRISDGETLAWMAFQGPQRHGQVTLTGWLTPKGEAAPNVPKAQDLGYQAVKKLTAWATSQDTTYFITSVTGPADRSWAEALRKAGFHPQELGGGEQVWELERPASTWMTTYLCFGLAVGISFGLSLFHNLSLGMCLGLCLGMAIGSVLDRSDKKLRQSLREERKQALDDRVQE